MVDFRKMLAPKVRDLDRSRLARLLAFQDMDRPAMANTLLAASRTLIDSGLFLGEDRSSQWRDPEFLLYRSIPALARRLDPGIDLRADETPRPGEGWEPLFDAQNKDTLLFSLEIGLGHKLLSIARPVPDDIRLAADFLKDHLRNRSAVELALDTLYPGRYPKRYEPDTLEPLRGYQLIGTFGDHDRVLRHSEDLDEIEDLFRIAGVKRQNGPLSDAEKGRLCDLRSSPERLDFDTLSLQSCDGAILRAMSFMREELEPEETLPFP